MTLLVLGINHRSAAVAVRERVAFAPDQLEDAHADALEHTGVSGLAILSTCNRTELIASAPDPDEARQALVHWLAGYHHLPVVDVQGCCYCHIAEAGLRHLMQVAAGLDSMVLGEPQIFGQMKSAFAVARDSNTVNGELGAVFPQVFAVAKRVRTDTAIGENPVSVAYAAVSLSRHIFSDLGSLRALLIGAGETIELVARHLLEQGVEKIVVANRTLSRARELAQRFGAEAVLLADIPQELEDADIVIASTASQLPILGKGAVESALKRRKHRPILMVDIAVPRDIEHEVGELDDVYLYSVDDLREIVDENMRARETEARKADQIIDAGITEFGRQQRSQDAVATVRAYRQKAEKIRDAELERAMRALERGDEPEAVLATLARSLTNKLLHSPSSQLRRASAMGRVEVITWTRELFEIIDDNSDEGLAGQNPDAPHGDDTSLDIEGGDEKPDSGSSDDDHIDEKRHRDEH